MTLLAVVALAGEASGAIPAAAAAAAALPTGLACLLVTLAASMTPAAEPSTAERTEVSCQLKISTCLCARCDYALAAVAANLMQTAVIVQSHEAL